MSLAKTIAAHCNADIGYYSDKGDVFHVRLYGNGKNGAGLTGLWHLMTDAEVAEVGRELGAASLTAHRFQPGGIIVAKAGGPTCYAVAVVALRLLGINAAQRFI